MITYRVLHCAPFVYQTHPLADPGGARPSHPLSVQFLSFSCRYQENLAKQDCIPEGCVPPACCPYLPACTALVGGGAWPGGCLLRGDAWSRGVSAPGWGCLVRGGCLPLVRGVGSIPACKSRVYILYSIDKDHLSPQVKPEFVQDV